jgi:hypothetical protein
VSGNFYDWFLSKEFVNNRTGSFYVGLVSIKMADLKAAIQITDEETCENSGLDKLVLSTILLY